MVKRFVLVLVLVLSPACSGGGTRTTNVPAGRSLKIAEAVTFRAADPGVVNLVTWDHYVAWAGGDSAAGPPDRLRVADLRNTATSTVLARTSWPHGQLDWVRGSRDVVLFTDMQTVPTDQSPTVPWKIVVISLSDRVAHVIAESRSASDEQYAPMPALEWPFAAWAELAPDAKSLQLLIYDLRSGTRCVVPQLKDPGAVSIANGNVVVDALSPKGRDVYSFAISDPDRITQLSESGQAAAPRAANGSVAWQEPTIGDPKALMFRTLGHRSRAIRFAPRPGDPPPSNNAFPGKDFVVWHRSGELIAAVPSNEPKLLSLEDDALSIAARWWVAGRRVAWAVLTTDGGEGTTIHVATIRKRSRA